MAQLKPDTTRYVLAIGVTIIVVTIIVGVTIILAIGVMITASYAVCTTRSSIRGFDVLGYIFTMSRKSLYPA